MTNLLIGDIKVDRIVETVFPFHSIENFYPNATQEQINACRPMFDNWALCPKTGKIILVVQSYLVRTLHHTVLIDTCLGRDTCVAQLLNWNTGVSRSWRDKLADKGVSPSDVDYVFCTHLHGDHIGWNTQLKDGRWVPTFPNAKYILSRKDFELMQMEEDNIAYKESILPVVESRQAEIVESDYVMDEHIWLEPTPGHTPGHVAVGLISRGTEAVMCGDLMHSPIQCLHPDWQARSDTDPHLAVKTRRAFLSENCDRQRWVMAAHFPEPSIGKIIQTNNAFRFVFR